MAYAKALLADNILILDSRAETCFAKALLRISLSGR